MTNWMLRGLVFAAAMVVVRLFQGALIKTWQTQPFLISVVLVTLFGIGVVVWGLIDGRADAAANPDPDRRQDLAMTWLLAGLVAGVIAGAVAWLISQFHTDIYVQGLINELTTFAAFVALLVFLPGIAAVAAGRWLVDRQFAKVPVRHHGLAATDEDRVDTDVFAAVRPDDTARGRAGMARGEEEPGAVATAQREGPTEVSPAYAEGPTEVAPTDSEETTEAIRPDYSGETTEAAPTEIDADRTEPTPKPGEDQR